MESAENWLALTAARVRAGTFAAREAQSAEKHRVLTAARVRTDTFAACDSAELLEWIKEE